MTTSAPTKFEIDVGRVRLFVTLPDDETITSIKLLTPSGLTYEFVGTDAEDFCCCVVLFHRAISTHESFDMSPQRRT